jgi:hydroxyacylglutathione hydrolase
VKPQGQQERFDITGEETDVKTFNIRPIKIHFGIPISPDNTIERFVYAYLIDGKRVCLIDTGVAGAEKDISIALRELDKNLSDVEMIILTHSHPDHMGAASSIKKNSGAQVWAHPNERTWIEDVECQARERPVPGFAGLVGGSVPVDRLLADGDLMSLGGGLTFSVLHTPGHSSGSISLLSEENGILFSGDLVPQTGCIPIYEDVIALAQSLARIAEIENLTALYSSWGDPLYSEDAVAAIYSGMRYLMKLHETAMNIFSESGDSDHMALFRQWVRVLGLPPFAANPLVMRSFLAHKEAAAQIDFNSILRPFLDS